MTFDLSHALRSNSLRSSCYLALLVSSLTVPFLANGDVFVSVLHDLQLIHTDLKPENILLVNSAARVVNEVVTAPGRVCLVLFCGTPFLFLL
jgi:serine/threonine protein kinase